jgi:hypothetical protein
MIEYGYLSRPYLSDPYLSGIVFEQVGMQVNRVITASDSEGVQANLVIRDEAYLASQVARTINGTTSLGTQVDRTITDEAFLGAQIDRSSRAEVELGSEVDRTIFSDEPLGSQAQRTISARFPLGSQVNREIEDGLKLLASEIRRSNYISIASCPNLGYLAEPYLSGPYLVAQFCAHTGGQVNRVIRNTISTGMQVDRQVQSTKVFGTQIERTINAVKNLATQINRIFTKSLGCQVRFVLYNTKKIRILCDFPSRGTAGAGNNAWGQGKGLGLNWIASSTLTGDFSPNNVNTDIVEQVFRSNNTLNATLSCDTEIVQGTAPDTIAILNHNWTTSAVVTLEGSNSDTFATIGILIPIEATAINSYYIAPTLPTQQFRYWRLSVADTTNPDGYIQVGTIIFGSAIIFQGEDIVDQIRRRTRHFSDKVPTEGFTNISNDRAIKRAVSISFNSLDYGRGNFANLMSVFETARTSLKCLWVPDPQDPGRFAVFGKLVDIPEEEHENRGEAADIVSLKVDVDESL